MVCRGCSQDYADHCQEQSQQRKAWCDQYPGRVAIPGIQDVVTFGPKLGKQKWYPCRHHTCDLGRHVSVGAPMFGLSYGARFSAGLNGHEVRLRVHLSLLMPVPRHPHGYKTMVGLDNQLPLFGALRHYWGKWLHVIGNVGIRCYQVPDGQEVRVEEYWPSAPILRAQSVRGNLLVGDLNVVVSGLLGPRRDVSVNSVHLQWGGTRFPPSAQAVVMRDSW